MEQKAKALTKEFGETFSDTVKVGIVVSIMPQAVEELVYQSIEDKLDYHGVTDGQDPVRRLQQGGDDGRPHPDGRWESRTRVRE